MRRVDSRRITGPHLLGAWPGAAVEVALDPGETPEAAREAWVARAGALVEALGWAALGCPFAWGARAWDPRPAGAIAPGQEPGPGWSLAVAAPPDLLETACLVAEQAADGVADLEALREEQAREANPSLRTLLAHARVRGWPAFWDDEGVTLGEGVRARTWALDAVPGASELGDATPAGIPVVLVTGTNGKTTTSRLLARMARAGGHVDALTSSDAIAVAGSVVRTGDWSGPGAARTALRDTRVTLAVLETARGGLLRRGVAVEGADVAVVTNVGADHLGEYGIDTLAGMADAKLSVALGLRAGGGLVVNAGCAPLMEGVERLRARRPDLRIVSFGDDGGAGVEIGGSWLPWSEVPLTLGGLARHNVENALGAVVAARALGISERAIAATLRTFAPSVEDSSGRTNLIAWRGRTVLVDFAHNPDGLLRLAPVVRGLPAARRCLVLGTAGDRTDAIIDACAEVAASYGCERYVVKELAGYLRGRAPGEVPARFVAGLRAHGVPAASIATAGDDVEAAREALAWSEPGDLVVLLVHERLDEVLGMLEAGG